LEREGSATELPLKNRCFQREGPETSPASIEGSEERCPLGSSRWIKADHSNPSLSFALKKRGKRTKDRGCPTKMKSNIEKLQQHRWVRQHRGFIFSRNEGGKHSELHDYQERCKESGKRGRKKEGERARPGAKRKKTPLQIFVRGEGNQRMLQRNSVKGREDAKAGRQAHFLSPSKSSQGKGNA